MPLEKLRLFIKDFSNKINIFLEILILFLYFITKLVGKRIQFCV